MRESEKLQEWLPQALAHLYDPEFLRKSPLVRMLHLDRAEKPGTALRTALEKAIEALRPAGEEPSTSKAWRHYHLLYYCYVRELTQTAAADRLGVSVRHLRRERAVALRALAHHLCSHYGLLKPTSASATEVAARGTPPSDAEVNRELLWLANSQGDRTAHVERVASEATRLLQPLAERHGVVLDVVLPAGLPPVAVADTVLKQVLINLLTAAIPSISGGKITLAARADGEGDVRIDLAAVAAAQGHCGTWPQPHLKVARQLVELFHGQLLLGGESDSVTAHVRLRQADQMVVLAIEDNEDTLQLWQRFVRNTRFRIVGATDPERALDMAVEVRPDLIVLDVMLPDVDGWELLSRLRHHPATASTPVIICTVLPQEELARFLGASDFMRKPMTGREFRAALERQIAAREQPRQPESPASGRAPKAPPAV